MRPNSPEVILTMLKSLKEAGLETQFLEADTLVDLCCPEDLEE